MPTSGSSSGQPPERLRRLAPGGYSALAGGLVLHTDGILAVLRGQFADSLN
jgi:hypothetical protein